MLWFFALSLQFFIGCYSQRTADKDQELIDYAIKLYYYPNDPPFTKPTKPEQHQGFKKREYLYDHVTCLHQSDFYGAIKDNILSHTICISLCDEHSECKGGAYSKRRNKCYLLKNVKCARPNEKEIFGLKRSGWSVFFFYNKNQCQAPDKGQQCKQTTTTSSAVTQATADAEKESEENEEYVANKVSNSIAIRLGNAEANPLEKLRKTEVEFAPKKTTVATSALKYKFQPLPEHVPQMIQIITPSVKEAETMYKSQKSQIWDQEMTELSELWKQEQIEIGHGVEQPMEEIKLSPAERMQKRIEAELDLETELRNQGILEPEETSKPQGSKNVPGPSKVKTGKEIKQKAKNLLAKQLKPEKSRIGADWPRVPQIDPEYHQYHQQEAKIEMIALAECIPARRKRESFMGCKKIVQKIGNSIEIMKKKIILGEKLDVNFLKNIKDRMKEKFNEKWEGVKSLKFKGFKRRMAQAGKVAAYGLLAYNLIDSLIQGDLEGVAMNVGFFILGYAIGKISEKLIEKGTQLLAQGMIKAGWLLKAAGPLLQSIGTVYVAYQFYKSIKNLNTSDPASVDAVIGNGILLGVELFQLGVFTLVTFGVIGATSALAVAVGPIGLAVTIGVIIGLRISSAVREVKKIEEKIKLSPWERFREGAKLFFTGSGLQYIDEYYKEKTANEIIRDEAIDILKKNNELKYCFMPSTIYSNGNVTVSDNSFINFISQQNYQYSRASPSGKGGYTTFCLPMTTSDAKDSHWDYFCENAFGVTDPGSKAKNGAFYQLGNGDDIVFGGDTENTYSIGNGFKGIHGNKNNDSFILYGDSTHGIFYGSAGYDIVEAERYHLKYNVYFEPFAGDMLIISQLPYTQHHEINQNDRSSEWDFAYTDKLLYAKNIEDIRGRASDPDIVVVPCNLKFLDTKGVTDKIHDRKDSITLQEKCNYDIHIVLSGNTKLRDFGNEGKVVYHISKLSGDIDVHLTYVTKQTNIFIFDYPIADLKDLEKDKIHQNTTIFTFSDNTDKTKMAYVSIQNINHETVILFRDNIAIRIGESNAYLIEHSDSLNAEQIYQKFKGTINQLGLILNARTLIDNSSIVAGHGQKNYGRMDESKNVLVNDPLDTTHIIAGSAKNVFLIIADDEKHQKSINDFSFPDVHIYYDQKTTSTDEIDLSVMSHKVQQFLHMQLGVEAHSDYHNKDITLLVNFVNNDGEKLKNVGKIILKDAFKTKIYKNIKISLYSGLAIDISNKETDDDDDSDVEGSDFEILLKPIPLVFDGKEHDIIILSEDDVSFGNQVIIEEELSDFDYFAYNSSLMITNAAKKGVDLENLLTVVLTNFYRSPKMRSLDLDFKDYFLPMRVTASMHNVLELPDSQNMFAHFEK